MIRNMKWILAASTATALVASPVVAQGISVKVATFVPAKSVGVSRVIKPWMARVEKALGDKIGLKGYWGGSLGKSPFKQYELVKNGVADITWVLPGYTPGQFRELQILELPFFAKTGMEASLLGQRLHEAKLLTGFGQVHLIGHWAAEPNAMFLRKKITSIAELKNLKIRSAGSVAGQWLRSVGAAPQTASSFKMNEMLKRGTLDGGIQGWTGMRTFKSFGLVNHAMDMPLGAIPFLLLMNKKKWDSLPKAIQAVMMKEGGEKIARAGGQAYETIGASIRTKIGAGGKHSVSKLSAAALNKAEAEAKANVHQWWIKKTANGQAIYDKSKAIIAAIRSGK